MSARSDQVQPAALSAFLSQALATGHGRPVAIFGLERLKGGYSREMWSFDADLDGDGSLSPLVLCTDSPTGVVEQGAESLNRVQEAMLLRAVGSAGLPVPRILVTDGPDSPLGRAYLVMERVDGTASVGPLISAAWDDSGRDAFAKQMARILGDLRRLAVPTEVFGHVPPRETVARLEIDRWAGAVRKTKGGSTPVVDDAIGWLEQHLPPPPERLVVVHGDYRTGNVMYGPEGLRALLDWEMAHPGDPLEDVAWAALVCWRLGTGRVGGLVAWERWLQLCQTAAEDRFDQAALDFWQVLAAVKIVSLMQRAADVIPPGPEQRLLLRLRTEVEGDLRRRLAT